MTKKIQILVIEDNRLLRDGLAALLDSQTEFKVVACAEGGSAALSRLQESKPNVVLVDAALEELVNTIRQVANGGDVVPPALTGTLLSHIAKQASVLRNTPMMASVRMTKREQQITDLIAEGLSNKEIAQRLNIATYTVKSHVHNILEKLALHSRLQIAAHAHKKTPPKGDRRKFVR